MLIPISNNNSPKSKEVKLVNEKIPFGIVPDKLLSTTELKETRIRAIKITKRFRFQTETKLKLKSIVSRLLNKPISGATNFSKN